MINIFISFDHLNQKKFVNYIIICYSMIHNLLNFQFNVNYLKKCHFNFIFINNFQSNYMIYVDFLNFNSFLNCNFAF